MSSGDSFLKVAVLNDPTNLGRSLLLLQKWLIKLKDGVARFRPR